MGLRQYLDTLNTGVESANTFATTADALRKQAAQQQFAEQAPGLIDQGQLSQAAGLSAQTGDMSLMNDLLKGKMAEQTALSKKEAKPNDVATPEHVAALEKLTGQPTGSMKSWIGGKLSDAQAFANSALKPEMLAQRADVQKEKDAINAIRDVGKSVAKLNEKPREDIMNLQNALDTYNQKPSKTASGLLMTELGRLVVGGRVPMQEINALNIKGAPQDAVNFANWITGMQAAPATAPEQEELNRIVKNVISGRKSNIQIQTANHIKERMDGSPEMVLDSNGNFRKQVVKELGNNGLIPVKNPDGTIEFKTRTTLAPVNPTSAETGQLDITKVMKQVDTIPDAITRDKIKQQLDKAVSQSKSSGKPINQAALNRLYSEFITPNLPK